MPLSYTDASTLATVLLDAATRADADARRTRDRSVRVALEARSSELYGLRARINAARDFAIDTALTKTDAGACLARWERALQRAAAGRPATERPRAL